MPDKIVKNPSSLNKWEFIKRGKALKAEGTLWMPTLKEISKYVYPTRGCFDEAKPNQGSKIDHKIVIDSAAEDAVGVMAAGLSSGLTSPSRPWFKLAVPDPDLMEDREVKIWLDDTCNRMRDVFQRSNIYGALMSDYEEIGCFGTAAMYIGEDYKEVVRARVFTIGEYYIGVGATGRVNAFYRRFQKTIGQIVEEFGIENVSDEVKAAWKNNQPDNYHFVNHLVEVNDNRIEDYEDFGNMEFREVYWEDNQKDGKYLFAGGYMEFPFMVPRWQTTTTADAYGRGPGWKALGDVKMLQKLQKEKLISVQKSNDPPLQADASVIGEVNASVPGGITRTSTSVPNSGVRAAYEVRPDLNAMEVTIEKTTAKINAKFFKDLFLMFVEADRTGRNITATEVMERQAEKLTVLGPVLERLEGELLSPLIERTFSIMVRKGLILPPPAVIEGMPLRIQYISVLAQAQKMAGVTAIDQWTSGVAASTAIDPEATDLVDMDEVNTMKADMLGVPAKVVRSKGAVAMRRKQRAQAQEQASKASQMIAMAEAAKKGAGAVKDMSQAPLNQNSALDSTLAGIAGTGGMRQ